MARSDFVAEYNDFFDKKLRSIFSQSQKELETLFWKAVNVGNVEKAQVYLARIKQIQESLKTDFFNRDNLRTKEEYIKGASYVSTTLDGVNFSASLGKIDPSDYIGRLGAVDEILQRMGSTHVSAIQAMIEGQTAKTFVSLDGISSNITRNLTQVYQVEAKEILAKGMIKGDLAIAKSDLISFFEKQGIGGLKDASGRTWTLERYADMIVRTDVKTANIQGTLNDAIENNITKFRIIEQANCCDICLEYRNKEIDISDGEIYDLPPYHPNCNGDIELII